MKLRITLMLGSCAILFGGHSAQAQDLPPLGGAAAVAPAAPAGPNLFTMLLPPPEMRERCRQKLCKCEIVKLLRAGLAPASAATGGLIPVGNCCPAITKEALALPADSSQGAAARIKKDVEEAGARREAVRYLGTVDCRYWPEAEEALINALRADRIECVRYEAALQLQRGCCCTKKIAKALTITIEGTDKDGFPAERSCRVQDAAALALSMCVFEDPVAPEPTKIDGKEPLKKQQARVNPKDFYKEVENAPDDKIYDNARKVLEKRNNITSTQILSQSHRASSQGLFGILTHAFDSTNETPAGTVRTGEPQAVAVNPQPQAQPQPQQAQRRGLLYKLLPAPAEETTTVSSTPVYVAPPVTNSAPTPTAPPKITTLPMTPSLPVASSQPLTPVNQPYPYAQPLPKPVVTQAAPPARFPSASDIRPASYTNVPANGTIVTDEPGFSTAAPMAPVAAPRRPAPLPQTSSAPPRADQGLLGFVIMDDAPVRR
jgi:hypothetical protein